MTLRRGSLGTAVRSHSGGDGGRGGPDLKESTAHSRTGPHLEGQRGSPAWSRPGARMRWAQASPPLGEGRLLGWSSACPGITPRRKTVPGLVPGRGQSEPHGPRTGPFCMASCKAVWLLSWAHPGDSGTLLHAEGACRDSHSTSKGLPPGTGRGPAITPGLLLTAGEGGGQSSRWIAGVWGESSGCRRSGGSLPGAQLRLEAEAPTGLHTPRGAAGALGKAGSFPGAGPAQPGTLC